MVIQRGNSRARIEKDKLRSKNEVPERTCFLHLGIHKTGSSAIQNVLAANYRQLIAAGWLFPKAGFKRAEFFQNATSGHQGLVSFLRRPGKHMDNPGRVALQRELAAHACPRLIISSELLSSFQAHNALEVVEEFRGLGFNVKIVVYLRRQDAWLDSYYRERLKWVEQHQETRSFLEFFEEEGAHGLDFERRIGSWVKAVGVANSIIRSYDDVQVRHGVVSDFLSVLDLDENLLDLTSARAEHNPSIPVSAAEFFLALNHVEGVSAQMKAALLTAVRNMDLFSRSTGSLIPPSMWKQLAAEYGAKNEGLRKGWLSGPSDRFSFHDGAGPKPTVVPAVSFADSLMLLKAITELPAQVLRLASSGI